MMVDLHTHILPGIDNGAADEQVTMKMLEIAAADGIAHITATPHYTYGQASYNASDIIKVCKSLMEKVKKRNIDIAVYPGCEVMISPEIPEILDEGAIAAINHSRYVLLELPAMGIPSYAYDVVYLIRQKGHIPIIAHPERNFDIFQNPNRLNELIGRGALAQLNSTSLTGFYGTRIKKLSFILLRHGMIHVVSSNAHTSRILAPKLREAKLLVEQELGLDAAQVLFSTNGMAILENRDIKCIEPQPIMPKRVHFILHTSSN